MDKICCPLSMWVGAYMCMRLSVAVYIPTRSHVSVSCVRDCMCKCVFDERGKGKPENLCISYETIRYCFLFFFWLVYDYVHNDYNFFPKKGAIAHLIFFKR